MRHTYVFGIIMWAVLVLLPSLSYGAIPRSISYQGRLTDLGGQPLDTTVAVSFFIYSDSSGMTVLWSETHSSVKITKGLFHALIGLVNPIPPGIFDGTSRWLGIQVEGSATAMNPVPIVAVAYAYHAARSDSANFATSIANNSVNSAKIADGSIQFGDIAQNGATPGEVMKWNGGAWTAELDATGGNVSGWTDNGTVVDLSTASDTVALNSSLRLGKLNINGNIALNATGRIYFGDDSTFVRGYSDGDMLVEGTGLYMRARDDMYFGDGAEYWMRLDNANKRVGIGVISAMDEMLQVENSQLGGRAFLQIETSHSSNFGEAGLRIKTPQNTWHLRMDDATNNNMPAGGLGLRSQSTGEAVTWEATGDEDHHDKTIKSYHGFPKPNYDSGWRAISPADSVVLTLNLGGNLDNYVIDMQFMDVEGIWIKGRHIWGYGIDYHSTYTGVAWEKLDTESIKLYRSSGDQLCEKVRIRIWLVSE